MICPLIIHPKVSYIQLKEKNCFSVYSELKKNMFLKKISRGISFFLKIQGKDMSREMSGWLLFTEIFGYILPGKTIHL